MGGLKVFCLPLQSGGNLSLPKDQLLLVKTVLVFYMDLKREEAVTQFSLEGQQFFSFSETLNP